MAYGLGAVEADVIEALPGEAFAAGELVGIAAGTGKLMKAIADFAPTQLAAVGIAQIAATAAMVSAAVERIVVIRRDRCDGAADLTPGATVYLSETAGEVTTTAPTGELSIVQAVGQAISATTFILDIGNGHYTTVPSRD